MANKFLDSNGLQHLIGKLKTEFSGKGIPSIRVSQIDTINTKEHCYEGKPVIYAVTSDKTPSVIIGIMQVFSDSMSHLITQILTTHCTYNISTKEFSFQKGADSHDDNKIYQCYRNYNINAPHLTNEAGTWSKWEPFVDATILNVIATLNTDIDKLKSTAVTLGNDGKIKSSQLPSYLDDVVEFASIVERANILQESYTGEGTVVYVSSANQFALFANSESSGSNIAGYYNNWEGRDNYSDDSFVPLKGKIFVDKSTDKLYRWNGSTLKEVSSAELKVSSITNNEIDNMINQ